MKLVTRGALVIASALAMTACVTRGEIEEIKKGQQEILTKLDAIAKAGPRAAQPQQPQRPQGPDPQKVYAVPVGDSAADGPADAWVTVVGVSEFQCPFCARVKPTLKQIKDTYGKDVRIVFKHNPLSFHNRAMPAALASECAREQGKFWDMHDLMFDNQRELEDTHLEGYAKKAGLDMGRWKQCYTSGKYRERIEQEQRQVVALGARGTPAFFINGRFLSGAQPFDAFKAIIDEELKKAKDSGIAKKDYYAQAVEQKGQKAL